MASDSTETAPYSPIIKICGIKTTDILSEALDAGADMLGFVHFARSPRHVDIDRIGEFISLTRGVAQSVVLLVNPDNSLVAEIASLDPDWIQLHGPETPQRVGAIRAESGVAVLKAVGVGSAQDIATAPQFEAVADRILLDAKPPRGANLPGGRGITFDWGLLSTLDPALQFMLSGGLTPENVAEAVRVIRPFGLDVSSGVESAPGIKDPELIRAFIANARRQALE